MGSIQPIKCFLYVDRTKGGDQEELRQGTLAFVKEDGTTFSVECKIGKEQNLSKIKGMQILSSLNLPKGKSVGVKEADIRSIESQSLSFTKGQETLEVTRCKGREDLKKKIEIASKEAFLAHWQRIEAQRKEREHAAKHSLKLKTRVFHVITGALVTPSEMISGVIRLAFSCAAVAVGALAFLAVKTAKAISRGRVEQLELAEKITGSFLWTAAYQVRIALLQLIPIIGSQLANQYWETGGLKGFIDAPAVGGLLGKIGLGAAQVVYGASSRRSLKMDSKRVKDFWSKRTPPYKDEKYFSLEHPSVADARKVLKEVCEREEAIVVRIPVKTKEGGERYHDGTLLLTSKEGKRKRDAPTVIMYHGRRGHRDSLLRVAQSYLDTGYNVLLASYAGDCVIQGNGKTYKEISTPCTEKAMREDAQADIIFLSELGARKIKIYGFSLGGAQAMNCAWTVGKGLPEVSRNLVVEEIILNKTFSHAEAVVERSARNKTKSPVLARFAKSLARRFFLDERTEEEQGKRHFLDNEAKLKEIVKNPRFQSTCFHFEGGTSDWLMGDLKNPRINFAQDLYETVVGSIGDAVDELRRPRANLLITEKDHAL